MSIHIGGRKIRELHYGGQKIREAYFGATKVWSSTPPEWQEHTAYTVGDLVLLNGVIYRATYPHRSSGGFRPGSGTFWSSAWEYVSTAGVIPQQSATNPMGYPEYKESRRYRRGDIVRTEVAMDEGVGWAFYEYISETNSNPHPVWDGNVNWKYLGVLNQ
ncbi:carbohydrate-binding protein [Corynebacterium propinquum]|uniref:carbohydrate-binding protein n=1 Tax=Corynebacterium propinquum TaxID=43769 RepID=UPI00254148AF|nr:carbohydrate-binding protein [Corynebacterium propinquum]MDK4235727.1 hypothetical protein [Corynebacterium propinquum]